MDIVNARSDFVRISEIGKSFQERHITTAGFQRDHVSVKTRDIRHDIVEFGITHVRMNLRIVADTGRSDTESTTCPIQISLPVLAAQRQTFTQSRFINLDNADTGFFKIGHFITNRQSDLVGDNRSRFIVADERPLQNGNRACQHRLHRLVGQTLCKLRPFNRHRIRSGNVTVNHRRLDATGAVRLNPAIDCHRHAIKKLSEILDHIVAFRFTVNEHVQSQFFLLGDTESDFFLHRFFIFRFRKGTTLERSACGTDLWRLRERTDCRRRESGQFETFALQGLTDLESRAATVHALFQITDPSGNLRIVYPVPFSQFNGLSGTIQRPGNSGISLLQTVFYGMDFFQFFSSERQTLLQTRVHLRFRFQRERNVQERTA